ncbi:MAG: hypothetical protein P4L20_13955, partial [Acidimicrobiales bacterium]|nr:hypothetical protein [Acidimicrobiales bacterium]
MANGEVGGPVVGPDGDSDGEGELDIPPAPLWAMRVRMHSHRHPDPGEEGRIRRRLGTGDDTLYVIDDGLDHCMVGRRVGRASDGCTYCLVARISLDRYTDLEAGDVAPAAAFAESRDISLCGVFEEEQAANVVLVQHYTRPRDVPLDYLPPSPFLEFTEDPEDPDDPGDPDDPD